CLTHQTALAEAEVEYEDHTSPSIYVRFPVVGDPGKADPRLRDRKAAFVIWTTTPWTMPANLAVVANPELDSVAIPRDGFRALEGTRYQPPFPRVKGDAERDYRLWFARHATLEAGTGLVHTAP